MCVKIEYFFYTILNTYKIMNDDMAAIIVDAVGHWHAHGRSDLAKAVALRYPEYRDGLGPLLHQLEAVEPAADAWAVGLDAAIEYAVEDDDADFARSLMSHFPEYRGRREMMLLCCRHHEMLDVLKWHLAESHIRNGRFVDGAVGDALVCAAAKYDEAMILLHLLRLRGPGRASDPLMTTDAYGRSIPLKTYCATNAPAAFEVLTEYTYI